MLALIRLVLGLLLLAVLWLGLTGLVRRDRSYIAGSVAAMVLLAIGVTGFIWHETTVRRETAGSLAPTLAADAEQTYKHLRLTAFTNLTECVAQLEILTGFYERHAERFGERLRRAHTLAEQWDARLEQMDVEEGRRFCSDESVLYDFVSEGQAELAALVGRG
jgi:hypothetical protein